jgi:hypothetical protein
MTTFLNRAATELNSPALADTGYDGAGHGSKTPIKQLAGRRTLRRREPHHTTGCHVVCAGQANHSPDLPAPTSLVETVVVPLGRKLGP